MIIEMTGPTGAGKTTYAAAIANEMSAQGQNVISIYGEMQGNNIGSQKLPSFLTDTTQHNWKTDLYLLPFFIFFSLRYARFTLFSLRMTLAAPSHRLSLFRAFLRKAGLYVFFKRRKFTHDIVLIDEGLFHSAHNFLVHVDRAASAKDIDKFITLVPKPDHVILVETPFDTLIAQLKARGNWSNRVQDEEQLRHFVRHACDVFAALAAHPKSKPCFISLNSLNTDILVLVQKILTH